MSTGMKMMMMAPQISKRATRAYLCKFSSNTYKMFVLVHKNSIRRTKNSKGHISDKCVIGVLGRSTT